MSNQEPVNFIEALGQVFDGKKMRHMDWARNLYVRWDGHKVVDEIGDGLDLNGWIDEPAAKCWVEYKEPVSEEIRKERERIRTRLKKELLHFPVESIIDAAIDDVDE